MSRIPPHDLDAERGVLGGAMLEASAADEALSMLTDECFYDPKHRAIFAAIREVALRNEAVDELTVGAVIKGESIYLSNLTLNTPTAVNVPYYAKIVLETAMQRQLIAAASEIQREAYNLPEGGAAALVDRAGARISQISLDHEEPIVASGRDIAKEQIKRVEAARAGGGARGLKTGFADLDDKLGGLLPSNFVVLAARPSMGKTALATNIVSHVAGEGRSALFFSLEMSTDEVGERILSADSRIDLNRLRHGHLGANDWPRLAAASNRLHLSGTYVVDKPSLGILEIRALSRRHKARHGLDLVVVDYLQLVTAGKGETREQEVAAISRGLKALAKELSIPVIALSQLNRGVESREDRRPRLSDLRESGAVEQDADVVLFVYRDDYYYGERSQDPGVAEIIIGKNRNGSTEGPVRLKWSGNFTRFDNLTKTEVGRTSRAAASPGARYAAQEEARS